MFDGFQNLGESLGISEVWWRVEMGEEGEEGEEEVIGHAEEWRERNCQRFRPEFQMLVLACVFLDD